MISLKQLQYALAVERKLHFGQAAKECAISQSALSTALTQMEKQLGFQVFERDNRKVLITPAGRQMLDRARQIDTLLNDIHALAETRRGPLAASITLGMIPTVAPFLLPKVMPTLKEDYPQLKLHIVEDQSAQLLEQLRRGALDAAVLALPYPCDGLLSFPFWAENLHWITQANDERTQLKQIDTEALAKAQLMLLKEGHCLSDHALAACNQPANAHHGFTATSLATLIQLVAGGVGSTLVPAMALEQLVTPNTLLASVPLNDAGPHREIAFVVRPNYAGLDNITHLKGIFREQLQRATQ